jgi:hypothetical protein
VGSARQPRAQTTRTGRSVPTARGLTVLHSNIKTAALAAGLALTGGLVVALPAGAATACGFDNGMVTMTVASGDNLVVSVGAQGELLFSGQPCATATVASTTEVDLSSTGGTSG